MDSRKTGYIYRPPGIGQPVQTEEVAVVVIVLLVWAMCVYIFFHQWGKNGFLHLFILVYFLDILIIRAFRLFAVIEI